LRASEPVIAIATSGKVNALIDEPSAETERPLQSHRQSAFRRSDAGGADSGTRAL
jgi:hypothetical protein